MVTGIPGLLVLGLNFNFNLGESKAWTLGIKPAIVYDMQGTYPETKSRFNANNAGFEVTAGLTYHFKTSNGTHHLPKSKCTTKWKLTV